MAYFRQLGVIGVLGACFFVAAGCGDDDDKTNPDGEAGEGGESTSGSAGKGGKSQGGSMSTGGTIAGTGGIPTAGKAGSATAGSANDGGAAGEIGAGGSSGEPPVVGGGAGEGGTPTTLGGAGAGGDVGAGGTPPVATFCATSCQGDEDCAVGEDTTAKCDSTHHCSVPSPACETHDDCVPAIGGWVACGVENVCDDGFVCVDWHGQALCAPAADPEFGCFPFNDIPLVRFGTEEPVTACGFLSVRCGDNKECFMGCSAFGCEGEGSVCDDASGRCGCTGIEQCPASPYENAPAVCE